MFRLPKNGLQRKKRYDSCMCACRIVLHFNYIIFFRCEKQRMNRNIDEFEQEIRRQQIIFVFEVLFGKISGKDMELKIWIIYKEKKIKNALILDSPSFLYVHHIFLGTYSHSFQHSYL